VAADPQRALAESRRMVQLPYDMDRSRRQTVLAALQERCVDRQWNLLAAHARTNHVHIVVDADAPPERVMNDLKSSASRSLNRLGLDEPFRRRWARHGSTRWLHQPASISAAIRYVVDEQGDPMAVFEALAPKR
jgi:REP element-mobilizing transposase RayT